jgi:selenocysteine lyase/cysteine desulfurase
MLSAAGDGDLRLVGDEVEVPLVSGERRRYVNLDYAASAPALASVARAVEEMLPWYSSVHRGAGFKSRAATAAYEGARESVRAFVGGRADDAVIFTRNTTDSLNLLAAALPPGTQVVAFAGEHHANLLPWQRCSVHYLPVAHSPDDLTERLDAALAGLPAGPRLVAATGASNVTGELWPLAAIAEVAHRHDAQLVVDAAQLAPHEPIDMTGDEIDFLAFSGHKLYAPYGAGALIGRPDWLGSGDPFLRGGGAVRLVTIDDVVWEEPPDRHEAGSPNVIGAVALGVACDTLRTYGMERLATEERAMLSAALRGLTSIPGFEHYRLWEADHPRVGLLTFNLHPYPYDLVAGVLSAEHGIGVRHGCFCAHPLMMALLRIGDVEAERLMAATRAGDHPRLPGAARISFGVGTTEADVDAVVEALAAVAAEGPRWSYAINPVSGEYEPDPDPRPLPTLPVRLASDHTSGESP